MTANTATTLLLYWVVLTTSTPTSCAQAPERLSRCGADRFAFQPTITAGPARRVYNDPIGRVVDCEVQRYLGSIGFTNRRSPQADSGIDSTGRTWWRDSIGYPYYIECRSGCPRRVYYHPQARTIAGQVNDALARVDLGRAVRGAGRGVMIRGLNGSGAIGVQIRKSVRDAVVRQLNQSRPGGGEPSSEFQRLVQAGIEDALVEAFDLIDDLPEDPRRGELNDPDSAQAAARAHVPSPQDATEAQGATKSVDRVKSDDIYSDSTVVAAGWVVSDGSVVPLTGGGSFTVAARRDRPTLVDVWQGGRRIAAGCRFARYYEEARTMLKQDTARWREDPLR